MTDDPRQTDRQPVPGPQFLDDPRPAVDASGLSGSRRVGLDPARIGIRLGLTAFIVATTIAGVLIVGAVGDQLGFDHWLGAGVRDRSLASIFVDGARLPTALLRSIYDTGVNDPLFFALTMLVLIPVIAGLAAARPFREDDASRSGAVRVVGLVTVGIVIVADVIIAVRLLGTDRPDFAMCLESPGWVGRLEGIAASDGVTTVLAILLAILAFRLPVDRWARVLGGTVALAAALGAIAAAAASASIVDGVSRDFPVVRAATEDRESLLLGRLSTGGTIHLDVAPPHTVSIATAVETLEIAGRRSIADTCLDGD